MQIYGKKEQARRKKFILRRKRAPGNTMLEPRLVLKEIMRPDIKGKKGSDPLRTNPIWLTLQLIKRKVYATKEILCKYNSGRGQVESQAGSPVLEHWPSGSGCRVIKDTGIKVLWCCLPPR